MAKRVKHRLWLEKQPVFFIRQVFGIISELHVAEPPDKFVDGIANIGSDFISNPWYEAWAEEAGLLHDPMSKQPIERTTMDVETPNMKYAYMAGGAITFAGIHYAMLSASDGPLPIMDYVALATAPKVARMGATAGGIVYDLTH